MNTKDTNPKDRIAVDKLPLSLVPETAIALQSLAHLDGALKYGTYNWRISGVRASVYVDACRRHLARWFNGRERDPDSELMELAHAMACLNIIVDAYYCGKLIDDRAPGVDLAPIFAEMQKDVRRLREMHKDKNPTHHVLREPVDLDALAERTQDEYFRGK